MRKGAQQNEEAQTNMGRGGCPKMPSTLLKFVPAPELSSMLVLLLLSRGHLQASGAGGDENGAAWMALARADE